MNGTKKYTEEEAKERKKQSNKESLARNYKQFRVNVRKENYYLWSEYAKSKGTSLHAMLHQFFSEAIEKDGFTPDIPYEDSIK